MNANDRPPSAKLKQKARAAKIAYLRQHWLLYAMLALPVAYYILFHYVPMAGISIAFKNYSIFRGVWSSPWTGWQNFEKLFSIAEFSRGN